jgi:rhamnosyltransferase
MIEFNFRKIAVMMATYNCISFIAEQIYSILEQKDVELVIFVSDDLSDDGTFEFLLDLSTTDGRIKLLSSDQKFGSAGKNFYRLITDVDISSFDYVAFADQDDIWTKSKLFDAITMLDSSKSDGYSSDVVAFWPDGQEVYVKKSYPQKEFDYMFEAPGPGCTFVLTKKLALLVKRLISSNHLGIQSFFHHDWLIYAIARSEGFKWFIHNKGTMHYRQHQSNEIGVNAGYKAFRERLNKLRSGWYLNHVYHLAKIFGKEYFLGRIIGGRDSSRFRFFMYFLQSRRRTREAILLLIFIIFRIAK